MSSESSNMFLGGVGVAAAGGMPVWLKAVGLSLLGLILPIKAIFLTSMFLVVADTVTGVWAAKKTGQPITSARLRRSFSKAVVYTIGILVCHFAGVHLLSIDWPVKFAAAAIGSVELLSILENLNRVQGGALFKGIITKLGSANDPNAPTDPSKKE